MKPRCYDRPPYGAEYTTFTGQVVQDQTSRDCGSWKAPEGQVPYPVLAGWSCAGCQWNPNEVRA
jgi:hypothetical protein